MMKTVLISNNEYTIADVYDDAAIIGKELEKIISNYGSDILKDLMPKVISVLELLENLIIKNEKENDELNDLKSRINSLENEKKQRLDEKEKFDKELEEIEDKWKQETLKLIDMVNKLKDDNKRLQEFVLNTKANPINQSGIEKVKQDELDYIKEIKEENIKLKDAIRFKDKELAQKNTDLDSFQSQVDSLTSTILNFRRKQIFSQTQTQKMVKEKAELECDLKEKEHQINILKSKISSRTSIQLAENEAEIQHENSSNVNSKNNNNLDESVETSDNEDRDPNRPRYTLNELQDVLKEKNELKVKLIETQEELEFIKREESQNQNQTGEVQGPINREPDEKLEPKSKQSGIRRFLNSLFPSF